MSIGGDEYDEQGRTGGAGTSTRRAPTRGTRIRLPGEDGDVYGVGRRPSGRPGRSLLMVVSVVVLLIAAIAFANRSGSSGSGGEETDGAGGGGPAAQPTAPTGTMPVQGEDAATGIPSGFPHTRQGAQSAAANYAVALGGDQMYSAAKRTAIVNAVYAPEIADQRLQELDQVYNDPEFLQRIGLEEDGTAPEGLTFVSRTVPVGSELLKYEDSSARVAVWYSALFGLAGEGSENPVTESWYTNTFELQWVNGDWKVKSFTQKDGPVPVGRDQRASSAEEIAEAVEGFGGFTYAR